MLQGLETSKSRVGSLILCITWVEMKQHDVYLLAVSLASGTVQFYRNALMVQQLDVSVSNPIAFMVSGRFGREDGVLVLLARGPLY